MDLLEMINSPDNEACMNISTVSQYSDYIGTNLIQSASPTRLEQNPTDAMNSKAMLYIKIKGKNMTE
jgi:hypothetical protein